VDQASAVAAESVVVRQLRMFVEWLGDGRRLTQTGRVTLADARALVSLLETGDEIDPKIGDRVFKTTTSAELPELTIIIEWAKAARLVRVSNGRLVPVKKTRALVDDPLRLWDRAFDTFPKLGAVLCPPGWVESLLRDEMEPAITAMLSRLYGGDASVSELYEIAWDTATARYLIDRAPEEHQRRWRRMNDQDTERVLRGLESLGAVESLGEVDDRVVRLTSIGLRGARRMLGEAAPGEPAYQIQVTLLETLDPVVWRRLLVSAGIHLDRLHRVVQAAMGWQDYHLHVFEVDDVRYGVPDPDWELDFIDERTVTLADVVHGGRTRIGYTYDFGDSWEHEIVVEKTLTVEEGVRYPLCLGGGGACPPEDCGGTPGYQRLRETLDDPSDPEHEHMVSWIGLEKAADFDPAAFDLAATRRALTRIR
jgi:hypothetical protein